MESNKDKSIDIPDLVYLERFVNSGTRTYSARSNQTKVPREYQPEAEECPSFDISIFRLPRQWVECTISNPSPALHRYFFPSDNETVSFAVHPVSFIAVEVDGDDETPWLDEIKDAQTRWGFHSIKVAPSASSRTVFVLDPKNKDTGDELPPFALKCHCPVRISRYYRHFQSKTVRHAVLISRELEQSNIPILPETIGMALPTADDGKRGWGFVVRELTPRPTILDRKTKLIPCFSLYGHDIHDPQGDPLLVKFIRNQSKKTPLDYVFDSIIVPIIHDFCKAYLQWGILLEAHGQNTLLEIDADTHEPLRIVHRDFDVVVDSRIRTGRGLQMESYKDIKLQNNAFKDQLEENWLSMIYDSSIGHHHFAYLAKLLQKYFSIEESLVEEKCRQIFAAAFPNSQDYFAKEICYYSEKPMVDDIYGVVPTGQKPIWRPS